MKVFIVKKKIIGLIGLAIIVLALIILIALLMNDNVLGVFMNNERQVPIYCVDTNEKKIAISFDAACGATHISSSGTRLKSLG